MNASETKIIRVLIVDDHPMVREGLGSMLATAADMQVVGEAGTGAEAIVQAEALQPDIVLLDLQLPDVDGVSVLKQIKTVAPDTLILIVTMHDNAAYMTQAMAGGAAGYVLKGIRRGELLAAIHTVYGADTVPTPILLGKRQQQRRHHGAQEPTYPADLSPVELDLLQLLAQGLSNKEISVRMRCSLGTVKKYLQRLFDKLHVSDRTRAVVAGIRRGLIV
jgi:DNA-binding NarL/FixJ family response regulator